MESWWPIVINRRWLRAGADLEKCVVRSSQCPPETPAPKTRAAPPGRASGGPGSGQRARVYLHRDSGSRLFGSRPRFRRRRRRRSPAVGATFTLNIPVRVLVIGQLYWYRQAYLM